MPEPSSPAPVPTPWPRIAAVVGLLTAALCVLIIAFAWPAARSEPRDVPLVVAGPEPAAAQVEARLEQADGDAFDVTHVADWDAAVAAIEDRDAYGAIVVDADGTEVLTASAASAVLAQGLEQLASSMASEAAGPNAPRVTDVVPAPADDPRGAGLAAGALPLVIGGLAGGAGMAVTVVGVWRQFAGAFALGVTGGLAMAAIWQFWLGSLEGPYLGNAGVIGLALVASASAVIGLHALIGRPGIGIGAAVLVLLGNPLSGLTTAPEMLPTGWGELGQLLPVGAAGSLLRSVAFFDGAEAMTPLIVLLGWVTAGFVLGTLGALRARRPEPVPVAVLD
jgi:hypothetical protein